MYVFSFLSRSKVKVSQCCLVVYCIGCSFFSDMFYVCVLWDKAVIDTTLKASFRFRSEDYTTCQAERHCFTTYTWGSQACSQCLYRHVHVSIVRCHKNVRISVHVHIVHLHPCLSITPCLWVFVCMTLLFYAFCVALLFSARALVSGYSYCANPYVCLSVPLCFSCCMALYMPLCYLCLQLVFGWHHTVSCPEPRCLCVQPSPCSCGHCSEFTICAHCHVMEPLDT